MFSLFLTSLYLLNLPPYKLYFLSTQNIFAILNMVVFLYILLPKGNRKILINKIAHQKKEVFLFSCLFIAISFSTVQSLDVILFLEKYASVLISCLFIVNLIFFDRKINKYIYSIIIFWIAINLMNDLFMMLNTKMYLTVISAFLSDKGYIMAKDVIFKNRLTISTYIEIFLPILYWKYFSSRNNKVILYISIILINILAFYSGWRIRGIISVISLVQIIYCFSNKVYYKGKTLKLILLVLPWLVFFIISFNDLSKSPTLNRIIYENEDAIDSDKNRTNILEQSIDIYLINPLFGIGLNNNYLYRANSKYNPEKKVNDSLRLVRETGSHNFYVDMLIEIGLIGFSILSLILLGCFSNDLKYLKKRNQFPYIFSFYLLLFYAFFHSIGGYRFFSILYVLRVLIKNNDYSTSDKYRLKKSYLRK